MRANETYSEAKRQFSVRNREILMNATPLIIKWWCTLKSTRRRCLRMLVRVVNWCASLVHYMLQDHFDSKQSR